MNGNRGHYTQAPLYNMKNKRPAQPPSQGPRAPKNGRHRFAVLSVILSVVLPILFLLALLIPNNTLRLVFLIVTGVALLAMWILRAFVKNARGTLTIIYAALSVVIGLALFMNSNSPEAMSVMGRNPAQQGPLNPVQKPQPPAVTPVPAEPEQPDPANAPVSAAQLRLEEFLNHWALGNIPDMLNLCVPSWVAHQESPERTLYQQMIQNSRPMSYLVERVEGSEGDTSRTISLKITIDQNNGTPPTLQRMQVLMMRVNDVWYVDPQSLNGTPVDEAAEAAMRNKQMPASTIRPTATPIPYAPGQDVRLYYNPNNGAYYHSGPSCPDVDERYWPMSSFTMAELNSENYKHLKPCKTCNAPTRPPAF